jgi:hypothetical protein
MASGTYALHVPAGRGFLAKGPASGRRFYRFRLSRNTVYAPAGNPPLIRLQSVDEMHRRRSRAAAGGR